MKHTGHNLSRLAFAPTVHCLTGCAIGEVLGMAIGTVLDWSNSANVLLSVLLAFVFGYSLTMRPLFASGLLRLRFSGWRSPQTQSLSPSWKSWTTRSRSSYRAQWRPCSGRDSSGKSRSLAACRRGGSVSSKPMADRAGTRACRGARAP
jgi:hypothetical protein